MPKFRVRKVSVFGYEGKDYKPGDIVELPESYAGRDFLEPVEEPKEPEKPVEKKTKKIVSKA
jgi:hypothetical protein